MLQTANVTKLRDDPSTAATVAALSECDRSADVANG